MRARLLGLCSLVLTLIGGGGGCSLNFDSDSLVRALRLLGARSGDAAAMSVADITASQSSLRLAVLVADPSGPGRRVAAPRPLSIRWSLCKTLHYDGDCPAPLPLGTGAALTLPLAGASAELQDALTRLGLEASADFLSEYPDQPVLPLTVTLPIYVEAKAAPDSSDPLDSELGLFHPRFILTAPGMDIVPNHNPALQEIVWSDRPDDQGAQPLPECPMDADAPCEGREWE